MKDRRDLILVADDDEDIVRFIEVNLRLEGFDVITAFDGEETLAQAQERMPDLVLLDVMMPKVDGFEVCRRLRANSKTRGISIIMLTAKSLSADKVVGLTAGSDDYMIKPFDPVEVVVRVKSTLRRAREMRALSPLTQLPGNIQIQDEIAARVDEREPFAVLHIDLDLFKALNDHYGFMRGDEAIKKLGECTLEAIEAHGGDGPFVGHVGGDDFIAVCDPEVAEQVAEDIAKRWDASVRDLYDAGDAERGYIEVRDRQRQIHRHPLVTVSIGIASTAQREISSLWEASEIASEMKNFAKRQQGSSYAIDRRRSSADEGPGARGPAPVPRSGEAATT